MRNVLVIDDDRSIGECFHELFKNIHNVLTAYNSSETFEILKHTQIDLIFLDYMLAGEDGIELLKTIKKIDINIPVILITAYGTMETIISAMSEGAYDYIEKPLDIDKIKILTGRAMESSRMRNFINIVNEEHLEAYNFKHIIGNSEAMQNIFKIVGGVVNNDVTVLITGESGTGKELIARAIHYNGIRKNEPFVAVNCSALTESLLDNELYGHEPQAFTGASGMRRGKFESAGAGTIFLDEIGDMSPATQAKLLRVLQEKEFQRLGGNKLIPLNARIITATNSDLLKKIQEGKFRNDLYYRINVATIHLPPLRERKEDISQLVNYFIKRISAKLKKNINMISNDALDIFKDYDWPGNVRELENVITNIAINIKNNVITSDVLPPNFFSVKNNSSIIDKFIDDYLLTLDVRENIVPVLFEKLEKRIIEKIGAELNFNKTAMAKEIGISRITLNKKI